MSRVCGDTSRFHRRLKARNRRRVATQKLREEIAARKAAAPPKPEKQ